MPHRRSKSVVTALLLIVLGGCGETSTEPIGTADGSTISDGGRRDASIPSDASVTASCTDGEKNGDESDVDCGGMCPERCGAQRSCVYTSDCATDHYCTNMMPKVCVPI